MHHPLFMELEAAMTDSRASREVQIPQRPPKASGCPTPRMSSQTHIPTQTSALLCEKLHLQNVTFSGLLFAQLFCLGLTAGVKAFMCALTASGGPDGGCERRTAVQNQNKCREKRLKACQDVPVAFIFITLPFCLFLLTNIVWVHMAKYCCGWIAGKFIQTQ